MAFVTEGGFRCRGDLGADAFDLRNALAGVASLQIMKRTPKSGHPSIHRAIGGKIGLRLGESGMTHSQAGTSLWGHTRPIILLFMCRFS